MSKRERYRPEYRHELVELVRLSVSSCRLFTLVVDANPALHGLRCRLSQLKIARASTRRQVERAESVIQLLQ